METAAINASQNVIEAAAIKLQETVAADAFRGIHLDPKTHHWDEVRNIFPLSGGPHS